MASPKKNYSKIITYLRDHDHVMYDIINEFNFGDALSTKNRTGVTFINPLDEGVRSLLQKLDMTKKDDYAKATDILSAHIIVDYLKDADSFRAKRDDIPNMLDKKVVINDRTTSFEITFENGTKAVPAPEFHSSKRIMVYNLVGGSLPTDGVDAEGKYLPKIARGKNIDKSAIDEDISDQKTKELRYEIMRNTEEEYSYKHRSSQSLSLFDKNAFVRTVFSLINYILLKEKDSVDEIYYCRILPLLTFTLADFYFVFEPFKIGKDYLVPNGIIERWKDSKLNINYSLMFNRVLNDLSTYNGSKSSVFMNRINVINHVDAIRQKNTISQPKNPRLYYQILSATYKAVFDRNMLSDDKSVNMYPEFLNNRYKSNSDLKLLEDEIRFVIARDSYMLDKKFSSRLYNNMLERVRNYFDERGDIKRRFMILNEDVLASVIDIGKFLLMIKRFINSNFLLYIPLTIDEAMDKFPIDGYSIKMDTKDGKVSMWNIHAEVYNKYKDVIAGETTNDLFDIDRIQALVDKAKSTPDKLTAEERQTLANCFR